MKTKSMAIGAVILFGAALVGCGQPAATGNAVGNNVATNAVNATNTTSPTNKTSADAVSARAYLKGTTQHPKVAGAASLTIDHKTKQMTVALELSGLKPGAKYSATVVDSSGTKVYALKPVTADKTGSAVSVTKLTKVAAFGTKWSVNVAQAGTVVATGHIKTTG